MCLLVIKSVLYATVCFQTSMGSPGVQVQIIYDRYPKVEEVFERLSLGGDTQFLMSALPA